jgi:hypothetical protein
METKICNTGTGLEHGLAAEAIGNFYQDEPVGDLIRNDHALPNCRAACRFPKQH